MSRTDTYVINDDQDWENIEIEIADISDVTFNVIGTGAESATVKYLEKNSLGKGFVLRPQANNVQIVSIGAKTFRNPITVAGNTVFSASSHMREFSSIVIRTTVANTVVRLLVF